jgi:branched-subunit amino acid ABC-type transport system permease component
LAALKIDYRQWKMVGPMMMIDHFAIVFIPGTGRPCLAPVAGLILGSFFSAF